MTRIVGVQPLMQPNRSTCLPPAAGPSRYESYSLPLRACGVRTLEGPAGKSRSYLVTDVPKAVEGIGLGYTQIDFLPEAFDRQLFYGRPFAYVAMHDAIYPHTLVVTEITRRRDFV
jgi:hypothetical protein